MKNIYPYIVLLGFLLFGLSSCGMDEPALSVVMATQLDTQQEVSQSTAIFMPEIDQLPEESERVNTYHLISVGDIMVHKSQLVRAKVEDGFDFSSSFKEIKALIESADYTMGNLETTLAGPYNQVPFNTEAFVDGYSGYPTFNAPDVLARNIKEAGFDLVLTANNHTLDSYESGVLRTLDVLDEIGLDHTGTFRTQEEAEQALWIEMGDVSLALINYTYAMNGFELDDEVDFRINHLGNYQETYMEEMTEKIREAKAASPDFLILAIHFGIEYELRPSSYYQERLVDQAILAGADIILGSHPHVVQGVEERIVVDEQGVEHHAFVVYSQGNFLSSQRFLYTGEPTDIGLVVDFEFRQVDHQAPELTSVGLLPTYTWWLGNEIKVVPITIDPTTDGLSAYDLQRLMVGKTLILPILSERLSSELEFDGEFFRYFLKEVDEIK